jgi:hypothetical protein
VDDGVSLGLGITLGLRSYGAGTNITVPGDGFGVETEGLTAIGTEGGTAIQTEGA